MYTSLNCVPLVCLIVTLFSYEVTCKKGFPKTFDKIALLHRLSEGNVGITVIKIPFLPPIYRYSFPAKREKKIQHVATSEHQIYPSVESEWVPHNVKAYPPSPSRHVLSVSDGNSFGHSDGSEDMSQRHSAYSESGSHGHPGYNKAPSGGISYGQSGQSEGPSEGISSGQSGYSEGPSGGHSSSHRPYISNLIRGHNHEVDGHSSRSEGPSESQGNAEYIGRHNYIYTALQLNRQSHPKTTQLEATLVTPTHAVDTAVGGSIQNTDVKELGSNSTQLQMPTTVK